MDNHDGGVSWNSSAYARSRWPWSASAGRRNGVARKPVER
jgi:hypothetical protein